MADDRTVILPEWEWPFSSNVLCYRYVGWARTLMVRFKSSPSTEYWYFSFLPDAYAALHGAPSKGKWIDANLKGKRGNPDPYRWEKFANLKGVSRP